MRLFGVISVYGLLIALGILIAVLLCAKNEARLGLPKDTAFDIALWCLPLGIIGARLYYCAFSWEQYRANPLSVLYIWEGGLAIYGGIIGGILGGFLLAKRKKLPFASLCDLVAPVLPLAQAIGRWGNFFNGEAYGAAITDAALQFFPYGVQVNGIWYQATFFYESMWDLCVFAALWFTRKKWRRGDGFPLYFILYGLGRLFIEGMRSDSLWWGNIRVSQLLSGLLIAAGALYFCLSRIKKSKITRK